MISKSLQLRKFAFALSLCAVVGASNAKAQYTVHANELISSTDFSNPLLSVDADLTSFSVNAFVGGSGATSNIRVRFPEWGAAGDVVNVIVKGNGGLLSASLLEDLSVKLYDSAGTIPVAEVTGSNILSLSLLAPFENIYSIKFITNPASTYKFKEAMLEVDNALSLSISDLRVYGFNYQRPCPPKLASTVLGSGSLGALSLASIENEGRVVDADPSNFATMNTTLSLLGLGSAYIDVAFDVNAKPGDFVGFTVGNPSGVLELGDLGGLSIVTYDVSGTVKETLSATALSIKLLDGTTDRYAVGFTAKAGAYEISKVRILKTAVLGLLTSIRVYNAFSYTLDRAPITITSGSATTFCEGGSVVLSAFDSLGSTDFEWNTGAKGASIIVTTPGTYFVKSMDLASCERRSIPIAVTVNPKPIQPVVALNSSILEIPNDFVYYQWYKNGVAIIGAVNHTYSITGPGKYYVLVTDVNGCVNTSTEFNVATTGISTFDATSNVRLYPNPTQNVVNIEAGFAVSVQVLDLMGKVVLQQENGHTVNLQSLAAGTYIFKIADAEGRFIRSEKVSKTAN